MGNQLQVIQLLHKVQSIYVFFLLIFNIFQTTNFLNYLVRTTCEMENFIISVERIEEYSTTTPEEVK